MFRGFSQTSEGAAIQGGFDATCGMFYAGVWASNLDWGPVTSFDGSTVSTWASIEVDLYAGLKGKLGRFGWDLGAIWYTYPNSTQNPFGTPFDDFRNEYVELKAGATTELWKDGTLGVTGYYSPDYQYETGTVWTLEVGFAQAFQAYWGFTPTVSALFGHQWGNDAGYALRITPTGADDEYSYWNAGLTLGFLEKWSIDVRYWDTEGDGCLAFGTSLGSCDGRVLGTVKYTF